MRALVMKLVRPLVVLAACAASACTATTDVIGRDEAPNTVPPVKKQLKPLAGMSELQSPFHDLLLHTDYEIGTAIDGAYDQLFHGDPQNGDPQDQVIYVPSGDGAYIYDAYHDDQRTEGFGLAMLFLVEYSKFREDIPARAATARDEFDNLWTYAKENLRVNDGSANTGYFKSKCDTATDSQQCFDPFGMEQFAMSLIFAHDVWGDDGRVDYQHDALEILDVMQHKEAQNGGIIDGVTDMFDSETYLAFDVPKVDAASMTRPSVLMPAYYALWSEATGDPFWDSAAKAAHDFFPKVADPNTGLVPLRAYFDGNPVPGSDTFLPEAYRALLNIVLDAIWQNGSAFNVPEANKILTFFSGQGIDKYGTSYQLDGTGVDHSREPSLVVVNGVTALISKNPDRKEYVQAVWDMPIRTGENRYYTGILQLFALLALSGKMQVL
jgi:oligosaccharide reducing-end xylanase